MTIPLPPDAVPLARLSPSQYEAGRACKARLAWTTAGRRDELPDHPKALLGISFHAVVEAAATGRFSTDNEERTSAAAREMFDQAATAAYERAHPLLRVKYPSVEVLPYYYLFRERASLMARRVADGRRPPSPPAGAVGRHAAPSRPLVERILTSSDGLLFGRPDYVDLQACEIVDYKTGAAADDAAAMSPAEARQLRLYVHLALENDLPVSRGVIVRPGGRRAEAEVTRSQADAEGRQARGVLEDFNRTASRPFEEVATPAAEACTFCPCIPFCEPFWRSATSVWLEPCGTHIEGRIIAVNESQVQGARVLTFQLDLSRGTVNAERAFVEQVPESWTTTRGCPPPKVGELIRIVHGRAALPAAIPVIHVDRLLTSLWTVPEPAERSAPEAHKNNGQPHSRSAQPDHVTDPQQRHST